MRSTGRRYRPVVVREAEVVQPGLPAAELIEKGLADLAEGAAMVESLLVSVGAPRLCMLGFELEPPFEDAEERLYLLLAASEPCGAHARYNAPVRRLVSFERAAESARSVKAPAPEPSGSRETAEGLPHR
jgi:hypothetical protein